MKYIYSILISFFLLGCSSQKMVDSYNDLSIKLAGNKPAAFVQFKDKKQMSQYQFDGKNFTVFMPLAEQKDWEQAGGWHASFHGKEISTLYLYKYGAYHIEFYSSIYKYGDDAIALENKDMEYFNKKYPQSTYKNGTVVSINNHIEYHGQEKYPCFVGESQKPYFDELEKSYACYKFNPQKTMVKEMIIRLSYTNPSLKDICPQFLKKQCDPNSKIFNAEKLCKQAKQTCSKENIQYMEQLSKEYTYEDLQERAKRVLDSLYIKDGWDK